MPIHPTKRFLLIVVALLAVTMASLAGGDVLGRDASTPIASPVVPAVCAFPGTPVSTMLDVQRSGCESASLGEPYRVGDIVVTMTFSSDRAAPQDISILITDLDGNPVTDASIFLINRHLEMNHGDYTHAFGHDHDGMYVEEKVGMGMGGRWQTEVQISRPGRATVTVVYQIKLKGIGE